MNQNQTNQIVCFTDLDDTLFQTPRKMTKSELASAQPGASDATGKVRSFINKKQQVLLNWLQNTSTLIPVTARQSEQMARVKINFNSYQVTTHGAVILDKNKQPLKVWQNKTNSDLARINSELEHLETCIQKILAKPQDYDLPGLDAWCRMNQEFGTNIYLVAKVRNSADEDQLSLLKQKVQQVSGITDDSDIYIHQNSNNLAWIPKCIAKKNAVEFLLEYDADLQNKLSIGIGDSLTDLPFMGLCDLIALPQKSQIWQGL
ncbi:hypothetical protein [Gayadomonas joobiniege]|uniref:hypothetical protein n=1 Tax=Gayadomonas joobiniege TaxID=1234606 RepID=UPI0003758ADE|nr:hypothetical protein [Gayadomonas joobiniege]